MKKLILHALLIGAAAFAGDSIYNSEVRDNGTTLALWSGIAQLSFTDGGVQTITDAEGYAIITNFVVTAADTGFTATTSNITVTAAGRYHVSSSLSFDTASASTMELDVFVDGVKASDDAGQEIGWRRDQGNVTSHGSASFSKVITLGAGAVVDLRIDAVGANEIATWHTGDFTIQKK